MGVQGLRKFISAMSCTKTIYPREAKRRSNSAPAAIGSGANDKAAKKPSAAVSALESRVASQVQNIFRSQQEGGNVNEAAATTAATFGKNNSNSINNTSGATSSSLAPATTATGRLPTAHHVLFDLNSLIHSCFNRLEGAMSTPQNTIDAVKHRLEEILTTIVSPTRTLTICLDGPAPLAKIRTQRLRRRRVSTVNMAHSRQFSELSITAGSSFMVKLEREVAVFLQTRYGDLFTSGGGGGKGKGGNAHHQPRVAVYLHGSTSAGEGESKISQMLAFHAYNPHTPYNPNDTVVIVGNDIDLTLTAMGCMYYHNTFVLSPSALQAFCIGDIIYRWLCSGSGFLQDAHYLPSARADLIFLFSLNGGDHFPGIGEAAADLWRRYKLLRTTNPSRMIVSEDLLSIDLAFLGDILQINEYEGQADPHVGTLLLRASLWATFTIITGTCPDYRFTVPDTILPSVSNLKAALVAANRGGGGGGRHGGGGGSSINIKYNPNAAPLTPLATYTAVMPTLEMFPDGALRALNTLPPTTKVNVRTLAAVHGGGSADGSSNNGVTYRLQPVNMTVETIRKHLANVNDTNMIVAGVEGLLKVAEDNGFLSPAEAARNSFSTPVLLTSPSAERVKRIADLQKDIGRGRLPENIKKKKEEELKAVFALGPAFEVKPINVRQPTNLAAPNADDAAANANNNSHQQQQQAPLSISDNYYTTVRELTFTNIFNYSINASFDDFESAASAKVASMAAFREMKQQQQGKQNDDEDDDANDDDDFPTTHEEALVAEEMNSFDRLLKRHMSSSDEAKAKKASASSSCPITDAAAGASGAAVAGAKTTVGGNTVRRIPIVQQIPEHLQAIRDKAIRIQNKDKLQRDFTNMLKGKRDREVADDDDNTRFRGGNSSKGGSRAEGGGAEKKQQQKQTKNRMEDDEDYDEDAMADLDIDDDDDDGDARRGAKGKKGSAKKGSSSKKNGRSLADLSDDDDDGYSGAFVDDYSDDEYAGADDGFGGGGKKKGGNKKATGGASSAGKKKVSGKRK